MELMEHEHLTFRVAYVSWPLWLLYGFYTAFIRLLASSPFGIVLARWFLRLLGFFTSDFICMLFREELTHDFNKCPNRPFFKS